MSFYIKQYQITMVIFAGHQVKNNQGIISSFYLLNTCFLDFISFAGYEKHEFSKTSILWILTFSLL